MEQESVFLSYVRNIFKTWAGFQQAIIEGMGGDYADEKEIWLGNEVENYFKRYGKVEPDEIEDYLGAMIENEFSTYFEDGSLQQVCRKFCAAYPLSLTNPDAEIFQNMRKKPLIKQLNITKSSQDSSESENQKNEPDMRKTPVIKPSNNCNSPQVVSESANQEHEQPVCEKMEQLTVSENSQEHNDDWTLVTRKSKRSNK